MGSQTRKKNSTSSPSNSGNGHEKQLKEIQNLLFGEQLGHVEQEIKDFHVEIEQRLRNIEKSIALSLDAQSKEMNKKISALTKSLQKLDQTQSSDVEDLTANITAVRDDLLSHHADNTKVQKGIEEELRSESNKLSLAMERQHKELTEKIKKSDRDLNHRKADRKVLSSLLISMAKNLEA